MSLYAIHGRDVLSFLVTKQPFPERLNCNGDNKEPFCEDGVPKNFCEKKEGAKGYEHPTQCDRFIYCDHGVRTDVRCPDRTGFNPHISNCDWMGFFRCVSIDKGNMYICIYDYIYYILYILYIIYLFYTIIYNISYIFNMLATNNVTKDTYMKYSYKAYKYSYYIYLLYKLSFHYRKFADFYLLFNKVIRNMLYRLR